MHRYSFVLYRPLQLIPVLFGISVLSFVLVKSIPGDPVRHAARHQGNAGNDGAHPRALWPR